MNRREGDARGIDPDRGLLTGEASAQRATATPPLKEAPAPMEVLRRTPAEAAAAAARTGYYGRPLIKQPVWIWTVPAYFWVGGVAGASAVLGAVARATGDPDLRPLVTRCRWLAFGGSTLGAGLLTADLGRPERFLFMLRVFRPSSPMNLGSWTLTASGATSAAAVLFDRAGGRAGRLCDAAAWASAAAGVVLCGYTGVLLAGTAVPLWQAAHRALPPLFVASSLASTAAALELMPQRSRREADVLRDLATIGKAAELGAAAWVDRAVRRVPQVAKPLRRGRPAALWKLGKALTLASLAVSLAPGESPRKRALAGAVGSGAALCYRFALHLAGKRSALDPEATLARQKAAQGGPEDGPAAAGGGPGAGAGAGTGRAAG